MRRPKGQVTRMSNLGARIGNTLEQMVAPTTKGKGTGFELRLASALLGIKDTTLFHNLVLPINGETTEIDLIVLGRKALYCFECKAYSGKIYGRVESTYWSEYLNGQQYKFYNPVFQNRKHVDALQCMLGEQLVPVLSVVVFDDTADISRIDTTGLKPTETICSLRNLYDVLRRLLSTRIYILTEEQYADVAASLARYKISSYDEMEKHVERLQEKHKSDTCPLCGSKLVLRRGCTEFYGCSGYPKCKYTRPVNR